METSTSSLPLVWQKRFFDIALSLVVLVVTSPLMALFIALIFVEHLLRGHPFDPVFYSETRISRGVPFRFYKFNTFNQRTLDEYRSRGEFIHTKKLEHNGDQILVGKFLKQIYLDELPQLYNVLRGEMSLVGPRPLNPQVFAKLESQGTPTLAVLLGGMTGNFQSLKDTKGADALNLDQSYLQTYLHKNGWVLVATDIKIMLRTLKVLLRAKGI